MVSRYQELLDEIPRGSFYDADGHILPRLDVPQQFLFATGAPSTKFGVFINDTFNGVVETAGASDPNLQPGEVIISADLKSGRHVVTIENDITAERFTAYVTVRDFAVWIASYAAALEGTPTFLGIDPAIDSVLAGTRLEEADVRHIEDAHGRLLEQPNNIGLVTDTYRYLLRRLRQAYRIWGAKLAGLRQVVSAYTSVLPFLVPKQWRPLWILEGQAAPNYTLQQFSRSTTDEIPDINRASNSAGLAFFSDVFTEPAVSPGAPTFVLNDPPVAQKLTVTFSPFGVIPGAWAGGDIVVTGTAPGGDVVSETFLAAAGTVVEGTRTFETITSVVNTVAGPATGFAAVGFAESRFVTIIGFKGNDALGVTIDLNYDKFLNELTWNHDAGIPPALGVPLPISADYELPSARTYPTFVSLAADPGGPGFDLSDGGGDEKNNRLWIDIGERGIVSVPLTTSLGSASVADIVADINTAFNADPSYGADAAAVFTGTDIVESAVRLFGDNFIEALGKDGTLRVHPGPADAALDVLGLPRFSATLSAPSSAFGTSLSVTSSRLPPSVSGDANDNYNVRVGRGLRHTDSLGLHLGSTGTNPTEIFAADISFGGGFGFRPHAAFVAQIADNVSVLFPGVSLPTPEIITVEFDLTWGSGDLTVNGTDEFGNFNAEVFTANPGGTFQRGTIKWQSISTVFHAGSGSGFGDAVVGLDRQPDENGGYIRIYNDLAANDGLHKIIEVLGRLRVVLLHEAGTPFTGAVVGDWQLWTPGEVVTVNEVSGGTLTLDSPGTAYVTTADNPLVELNEEMPFQRNGRDGNGSICVTVDRDFEPAGPRTNSITLEGSPVPDGWHVHDTGSTAFTGTVTSINEAYFARSKMVITRGAADIEMDASIPDIVPTYRGFPIRVTFWVQQHVSRATQDFRIDVSWDGGTTFVPLGTTAVAGTPMEATDTLGALDPTIVTESVNVPHDAIGMIARLVHLGAGAGERISIERTTVIAETHHALFLGENTVVRDEHTEKFGELLYVWSADNLDPASASTAVEAQILQATRDSLGMPEPPALRPDSPGHIDLITNAHGKWERVDVSEYDGGGDPVNMIGAITDVNWGAATLTNMAEQPGIPGRLSEVIPSRVSLIQGEELDPDPFGVASLANLSTHSGPFSQIPNGTARLYRDGVPLPDRPDASAVQPWAFTAADEITIDPTEFSAAATYTIDYDVLMRAETEVLNLGDGFTDYLWLVDAAIYSRTENDISARTDTQQLVFRANFTAPLTIAGNTDQTTAVLTQDDGVNRITVPEQNWRFVDSRTVSIDSSSFNSTAIYTLEYELQDNLFNRAPTFTIEGRRAATAGAVPAAVWEVLDIDQPVPTTGGLRFHQFRITITGVTDVRDIRVGSLGVRGINMFGSPPNAPGIITP